MRYCDTFCGLGGFSIAMKQIHPDAECVWAIDFDKKVSDIFKLNHGVECFGDIKKADSSAIPSHDIIFGGFPCQPFSRNGKWFNKNKMIVGAEENRDNLFLELIGILKAKQPKYFLFENVPGLIKMKNIDGSSYYDTILGCLCGANYTVYSSILDAADFGLPQQRKRVFFVGIREDLNQQFSFPRRLPRISSISDILLPDVDKKYWLESAWKNRKLNLKKPEKKNHSYFKGDSRIKAINEIYSNSHKVIEKTHKIEPVAILYGDTPSGLPRQQDKIYSLLGISPTIATFSTPSVDTAPPRMLTPRECARLQGIPDSFLLHPKDSIAYKQIGNSVAVPVIVELIKELLKEQK